jgi:hypothetical protein
VRRWIGFGVVTTLLTLGVGCSVLLDFDKLRGPGNDLGVDEDLAGADLTGVIEDLAGADLTGVDLAGVDLAGSSCVPGMTSFATTAVQAFSGAASPSTMGSGRFNADGRDDVAVINSGSGAVSVYFGQAKGGGSLLQSGTVPPQCPQFAADPAYAKDLVVADVTGDGHPDIVVLCQGSDAGVAKAFLMTLKSNNDGSFTALAPSPTVGATSTTAMTAGRFAVHANNALDIAISSYLDVTSPGGFTFYGDGAGVFSVGPDLPGMYYPYLIAAGKLTSDAYDDLLLVYYNEGWVVTNSDGMWPTTIPTPTPLTRNPYGPDLNAEVVAIGDVDGDGRGDIIWASDTKLSVFRNATATQWPASGDGSGANTEVDTSTGGGIGLSTIGIGVRDLDCDGREDVVIVGVNGVGAVGTRILIAGDASAKGSLNAIGSTMTLGTLGAAGTVTFGDYDGDGDVEILASGWNGNQTGEGWIIDNLLVP